MHSALSVQRNQNNCSQTTLSWEKPVVLTNDIHCTNRTTHHALRFVPVSSKQNLVNFDSHFLLSAVPFPTLGSGNGRDGVCHMRSVSACTVLPLRIPLPPGQLGQASRHIAQLAPQSEWTYWVAGGWLRWQDLLLQFVVGTAICI